MKELREYEYTGREFTCIWSVFMDDEDQTQAFKSGKVYKEVIPNECPISVVGSQICLIDDSDEMHFVGKENSKWLVDHFRDAAASVCTKTR